MTVEITPGGECYQNLANLTISAGGASVPFSPSFDSETFEYTFTMPDADVSINATCGLSCDILKVVGINADTDPSDDYYYTYGYNRLDITKVGTADNHGLEYNAPTVVGKYFEVTCDEKMVGGFRPLRSVSFSFPSGIVIQGPSINRISERNGENLTDAGIQYKLSFTVGGSVQEHFELSVEFLFSSANDIEVLGQLTDSRLVIDNFYVMGTNSGAQNTRHINIYGNTTGSVDIQQQNNFLTSPQLEASGIIYNADPGNTVKFNVTQASGYELDFADDGNGHVKNGHYPKVLNEGAFVETSYFDEGGTRWFTFTMPDAYISLYLDYRRPIQLVINNYSYAVTGQTATVTIDSGTTVTDGVHYVYHGSVVNYTLNITGNGLNASDFGISYSYDSEMETIPESDVTYVPDPNDPLKATGSFITPHMSTNILNMTVTPKQVGFNSPTPPVENGEDTDEEENP